MRSKIKFFLVLMALFVFLFVFYKGFKKIPLFRAPEKISKPEIAGVKAKDFLLEDIDGELVRLSSYEDKQPVILFFWTTWCPYCLIEMSELNDLYPKFKNLGIELLCINVRENKRKIQHYLSLHRTECRILQDTDARVAYDYRLIGLPTFVLINREGFVIFKNNYFPKEGYRKLLLED